jgi:hypothetical protein
LIDGSIPFATTFGVGSKSFLQMICQPKIIHNQAAGLSL